MSKSVIPEGRVRVTFNIPVELLEKVRERANKEAWSNTTLFIEALKEFTKDN